jgi:hypothetical protein
MEAASFLETLVITSQHGVIPEDIFTTNFLKTSNLTSMVCCKKLGGLYWVTATPTASESQLRKH